MPLSPAERSLRASIAAHTRWSNTPAAERRRLADRGHDALLAKFAEEVDPDHLLDPAERTRLARNRFAAHMKRLALASAKARRGAA
jgi:hypothetical protein